LLSVQEEVKSLFSYLRSLVRTEQENDDGVFNFLDLIFGNSLVSQILDGYLDLIVQLPFGQAETRLFGCIQTTVWIYEDVGLVKNGQMCPKSTKDIVRTTLEQCKIVFWPLHVTTAKTGHYVLAIFYTQVKRIFLLDSSHHEANCSAIAEVSLLHQIFAQILAYTKTEC
jgi:hypothetical protein